jgi:hypothetical protein
MGKLSTGDPLAERRLAKLDRIYCHFDSGEGTARRVLHLKAVWAKVEDVQGCGAEWLSDGL